MHRTKLILAIALVASIAFANSAAQAAEYTIDPVHSIVVYRIKHVQASYSYGVFTGLSGAFQFDPENPEAASVKVTVETASLNSFHPVRDEHLKGPDFFDAAKYPEMTFKSTAWKKVKENVFAITGDFTLRGVTRQVTLDAEFVGIGAGMKDEKRAGFEAVFTIKRSDYGMSAYLPDAIADEVRITVSLEGVQK